LVAICFQCIQTRKLTKRRFRRLVIHKGGFFFSPEDPKVFTNTIYPYMRNPRFTFAGFRVAMYSLKTRRELLSPTPSVALVLLVGSSAQVVSLIIKAVAVFMVNFN
jgi:hypothetical protein